MNNICRHNRKGPGASRIPFIPLMAVTAALVVISAGEGCGWPVSLYSSPVMIVLWGLAVVAAVWALTVRKTWKRPATLFIHVALIVILAGAVITHFTADETTVHLRAEGAPENPDVVSSEQVVAESADVAGPSDLSGISLREFRVETYPGTSTPMDFVSVLHTPDGKTMELHMNKTLRVGDYKVIQSQFDSDGAGVTLKCSSDVWGTAVTFIGYAMLGLSFLFYFLERGSVFRNALRRLTAEAAVLFVASVSVSASAAEMPEPVRDDFMRLMVMHNGRVATMSTLAGDFTSTVTGGKSGFGGMDADGVMRAFLFDFGSMKDKPLIRVKDAGLRSILAIDGKYASYGDYMRAITSGRLDVEDNATARRYAEDIARFEAINMLVSGELLKMYPVRSERGVEWYSPVNVPSRGIDTDRWIFIRKSMGYLNEALLAGDAATAGKIVAGIGDYQRKESGLSVPVWKARLEHLYHRCASAIPLLVLLVCAALAIWIAALTGHGSASWCMWGGRAVCFAGLLCVSALIAVRWIVGGHVPLSNGFETMQFMAWCLLLVGLAGGWRFRMLLPAAMFAAGLALGVAAMSGAARSVGNLVPVLASPLLSVHVVLVMFAYSLFLLLALNGVAGLLAGEARRGERLMYVGRVMLYPAEFLLGAGIFVGAVWADVSWGDFWSWDPKETWALITMLVYSFALHPASLRGFSRPKLFHIYMIVAFLSVLVTYFGVNFYLGGMHSYA